MAVLPSNLPEYPDGDPRDTGKRGSPAVIGMWLFLASLTMLFLASMLGYTLIRTTGQSHVQRGSVHLPSLLWVSTAIVIIASVTIHRALSAVRAGKLAAMRSWLWMTLILAIAFVAVQMPSLFELLKVHRAQVHANQGFNDRSNTAMYGIIFVLILLHAVHVVGGIYWLARVLHRAVAGKYDQAHHVGVRHAALYWHFLDLVWLVMFGTMWILG